MDVDEFARCEGLHVIAGAELFSNTWAIQKPNDALPAKRGPLGVGKVFPAGRR